jgi:CubicO group peptidase (beta-lactamase class C family)
MKNFCQYRIAILLTCCFFILQTVAAQTTPVPTADQIIAKVNEYMDAAQRVDHFSGTILLARGGRPIVSKGYGMANYELDAPNTPQTIFRLGSVTKQFTSAAIMLLQERGKLSVNDPVCKYVTDCPAAWEPITIRHLLTHTSGIPNYTAFPGFMEKKSILPITTAELVTEYKAKPLEFTPGEKFNYSNSGYHLLGAVIEKASGKSYADFLQENIFTPLGLKNTGYDFTKPLLKHRAAGYVRDGEGLANAPYIDMLIPYAAGSLYSTTEDLLTWEQALYTEKLLTKKSLDEMFTPFKGTYAYGWGVGKRLEHASISHGGSINGFSTYIARYPDDKVTVIVLSNVQGASTDKVATALAAIAFGAKYDLPKERIAINLPAETLEQYIGDFQLTPAITFTISREENKLFLSIIGQPKMQLFAESDTKFFLKVVDAQITFVKDETGKVTQLLFRQGSGGGQPAKKVK